MYKQLSHTNHINIQKENVSAFINLKTLRM